MSDHLDPYSEWLGIAPHEQPPNYYRLLELAPYESDPARINAHARRQFQRLSPHMGGPDHGTAEALVNEITAAGRCLLDAKAKQEYDAQLFASGVAQPPANIPPPAVPPPVVPPVHPPISEEPAEGPVAMAADSISSVESNFAEEDRIAPVHVAPRATQVRARRRQGQRLRFQFLGHLLVPIVSLGIAWAIIKMIRPDFDLSKFLTFSQSQPEQELLGQPAPAVPNSRASRPPRRPPDEQAIRDPDPETPLESTAQDAAPLVEPMAEPANASSIAFLPDAVDLPPDDDSEWTTVAEQTLAQDLECRLVLISDLLGSEHERRLGLTESTSPSGVSTWHIHPQAIGTGKNDETQQPAELPLAEFSWEEGRLKFQWKFTSDENLRVTLRNALLNVRIGDEEKLVQLRQPMKVPSLMLDLSKKSLQMPLEIPHLPPLEKLRLQITNVDFSGLEHQLDEGQREANIGQKLPILVTTPPGVRFQVWAASVGDQLAFRAEGHYWLGSTTPIEFSKTHVERQMKTFLQRGRSAEAAIPRLQNSIRTIESRINAYNRRLAQIPPTVPNAHARATLRLQIQGMQASVAAGKAKQEQARRTNIAAVQGIAALREVAKLGDIIHNQAPFDYRIYLPFVFEGVPLEVVLLEAAGRDVADPVEESSTFSSDSLADTQLRESVPSKEDREAARESLAAEYKAKYQEANDRSSRKRLAATLLEQASETTDDPARQFETFRLAWVILIQAGDLQAAMEAADQIEQLFEVERVPLRAAIVDAATRAPAFSERPFVVVEEVLSVIDEAMLAEDLELAVKLVNLAKNLQEKTPNARLTQEIEQRVAFLEAEQQLQAEEAHLHANPDDTEAHMRFGRLALRQGRPWEDCLSRLSKGGDDSLAEAARADLMAPAEPADQVALADRWFDLARSDDELQLRLEERAAKWYAEALPHLQGFSKTKVEARLKSLSAGQPGAEQSGLEDEGPAQIELLSGVVRIGNLRNGETAFSNRKYVWRNVPSDAPFSQFAMIAGGGELQVIVRVVDSGILYVANGSEATKGLEDLKRSGWEETGFTFNCTGPNNTQMVVYKKRVSAGTITLPRTGWAGPVVLLP